MDWLKKLTKAAPVGAGKTQQETHPLVAKQAWCSVCDGMTKFTKVWRRVAFMGSCPQCGLVFETPELLYSRFQPACPRCAEPLEQPSFDYGLCDCCGSKFELVEGAKPGLLPNKRQRDEMLKHGRSWSPL